MPNLVKLEDKMKKYHDVRSGIRTHAHRSGLRPERSALDLSAILTVASLGIKSYKGNMAPMISCPDQEKGSCPECGKGFSPTGNRTRAFHVTGGDPHH